MPTLDLANATALVPRATCMVPPAAGFGQDGEDMHAYKTYFAGMRDGVFLEMGALDGAPLNGKGSCQNRHQG